MLECSNFATMKMSLFKQHKFAITRYLIVVLLFITFDFTCFTTDVTCITTTIECESESFSDFFEDISNEDACFENVAFDRLDALKFTLPAPSFLLISELTNQVWQPPKL